MANDSNSNASFKCFLLTTEYIQTLEVFRLTSHRFRLSTFLSSVILIPFIIIGNGLVLGVILRRPSLRTTSNFLISCLSVADFLNGLVFLPLFSAWTISDSALHSCPFHGLLSCVGWLINSVSFGTMVAVSVERYIALFYHLKYPVIVSKKRIQKVIFVLWLVAAVFSCLSLFHFFNFIRFPIIGFIFAMGLVIIIFTYTRIFALVRRHHRSIRAQETTNTTKYRQRKLAVTMAYVIATSAICYFPFGCALFVVLIRGFTIKSFHIFHLSKLLFCISSLINPLIYCLRNKELRTAVISLLRDIYRAIIQL
ncbi:melanocyte-stimulating hormone receptor-like isoform X1 [Actinia tenebrosa]|uniref:Melanocyte-stimulating hormone receptor-like isoform X1 n=1 Tax=Actinia tenebrosa TaxID=6105 RepID=A0A6P8I3K9_ACTTE|nr:melanocyte-stimulating hormone receptor-like isoform X1 [Actinia tenebrosa]